MKRFIEKNLLDWKSKSDRKPLIIRGARQVGKTYTIRKFGQEYFTNCVILDFERNPEYKKVFLVNKDIHRICMEIELLTGRKINPGTTLLFLDEIQECPEAISSLRYFYEEYPALHVIAAGSLLDFALQRISVPVGRIQFLWLRPLTFAEFLQASGKTEMLDVIRNRGQSISAVIHSHMMETVRTYFFIGGMPESINAWISSNSYSASQSVLRDIITTYRMDFAKYIPRVDPGCLNEVFLNISRSIGKQTKYVRLAEGFTNPTIKSACQTLERGSLIHRIPSVNPSGQPLSATSSGNIFKLLLVDIGMMHVLNGISNVHEFLYDDLLKIYRGAIAEQFLGQELLFATGGSLFYWSRQAKSSSAEVDYLFEQGQDLIPVEVKNAPEGRLTSLHLLMRDFPLVKQAYIYYTGPFSVTQDQRFVYHPLYNTPLLYMDK